MYLVGIIVAWFMIIGAFESIILLCIGAFVMDYRCIVTRLGVCSRISWIVHGILVDYRCMI